MTGFDTIARMKRPKMPGFWHRLGKKRLFRTLAKRGFSFALFGYRVLYKTLRVRLLDARGRPILAQALPKKAIYIGWHGNMAIVPAFFSRLGVTFLASKSRDARLYGQFLRAFGGRLAIGSRAEDGPAGVMNAIRTLQSGRPVALSPDGPKGPRHQLKPGVAFVALAAKAFVVPIGVYAKSKVVLRNSWDKAWIPLPFSSVLLVVADPIDPEAFEGQGKDALEALRRAIQSRLEEVEFKAKAFCHDGRKQGRTFQGV